MSNRSITVAVVGGGIGGAAAALFLEEADVPVTVFERADELREVGAGIQVSPNAARLLRRVGVADDIARVASQPDVIWQFHRWRDGEVIFEQEVKDHHRQAWGAPYFLVHRAKLLAALCAKLGEDTLRLNTPVTEVRPHEDGRYEVLTEGGESLGLFDAIVVADGIQSPLRAQLFGYAPPKFSGYYAFRAMAAVDRVPIPRSPATMAIWLGPDRHFVHYPMERGDLVNLVCAVPTPDWPHESSWADGTVEEFAEAFRGWHPTVLDLINAAETTRKFALYYSDAYPNWIDGGVALLGDAAHPMLSFFAQGSGQAIEDAVILARCLGEAQPGMVGEALAKYEAIRKPRASKVQLDANGRLYSYHFPDGAEQEARDARLRNADPMTANSWVYEHDVACDFENASSVSSEALSVTDAR